MRWAMNMVAMKDARFIRRVLAPFMGMTRFVNVSKAPWGRPKDAVDNGELMFELHSAACDTIQDYWPTEEDQRNALLETMAGNYDFVWIVDTDEIYDASQVQAAMQWVEDKERSFAAFGRADMAPDIYFIPQDIYWKTEEYKVEVDHWYGGVAIVKPSVRFVDKRNYDPAKCRVSRIPGDVATCKHMSFVGDDAAMREKLRYNGHREEWRGDWFEKVWKNWRPEMRNIHPGRADTFKKAVPC